MSGFSSRVTDTSIIYEFGIIYPFVRGYHARPVAMRCTDQRLFGTYSRDYSQLLRRDEDLFDPPDHYTVADPDLSVTNGYTLNFRRLT